MFTTQPLADFSSGKHSCIQRRGPAKPLAESARASSFPHARSTGGQRGAYVDPIGRIGNDRNRLGAVGAQLLGDRVECQERASDQDDQRAAAPRASAMPRPTPYPARLPTRLVRVAPRADLRCIW